MKRLLLSIALAVFAVVGTLTTMQVAVPGSVIGVAQASTSYTVHLLRWQGGNLVEYAHYSNLNSWQTAQAYGFDAINDGFADSFTIETVTSGGDDKQQN
jgi:hypothetical protein